MPCTRTPNPPRRGVTKLGLARQKTVPARRCIHYIRLCIYLYYNISTICVHYIRLCVCIYIFIHSTYLLDHLLQHEQGALPLPHARARGDGLRVRLRVGPHPVVGDLYVWFMCGWVGVFFKK